MTRVVVTDGDQRSALAIVRSLGRAGHRVTVCSGSGDSLAGASKHATGGERALPDPAAGPEAYRRRLVEICREAEAEVLIPVTDAALEAALARPEAFLPTRLPPPSFDVYRRISDKRGLLARARELDIPTPAEVEIPAAGAAIDPAELPPFPLVVKPARSVVAEADRQVRTSVAHAFDREELDRRLAGYPPEAYPLLVQQYVPGIGEGAFFLRWNGRVVASFAHRRIREKPPAAGVSVYRESVPLAPDLDEYSRRILEDFDWSGVAMVEFRRSLSDGIPYLMEVNGRFWGSLQLAIDAGVDFPALLLECMEGPMPDPVNGYRTGLRSRWWLGDLDHLIIRMKRSTPAYRMPPEAGSRGRALLRFAIPWKPGDRSEVFRLADPRPGWRELVEWVRSSGTGFRKPRRGPRP